jgi:FtsP/CotA-like multicopper oxidase with cupredoxin domain
MKVTRRQFLKTAVGAAVAAGIPAFPLSYAHSQTKQGVREFHFSASPARVNLGAGPDFIAWTYNGQIPGPEIRVREGEIIRVILKNFLPEGTTIHWHGVPVPNRMDGVPVVTQKAVMPGETFIYEFEAKPAGSYMYHSHVHYQLDQGLYGPLIIEPARPAGSYDREYTLALEDWVMRDGGGIAETERRSTMGGMGGMGMGRGMGGMGGRGMMRGGGGGRGGLASSAGPLLEPVYDGYAVNGRVGPAITPLEVSKGDKVKLRLLNPSSATIYVLRLAGHTLTITHVDGRPIKPIQTDVLRIGMGERYDVEFLADNPGNWLLAAAEQGFGEGQLRIPVRYKGIKQKEAEAPTFYRGLRFATYWDFQALNPSVASDLGPVDRVYTQTLSGGMHSPYWTINGYVYPDSERLAVSAGETIGISYGNQSMMPHPMHLHGHFFRVVNQSLPRERWTLKDTIIVDPMQRVDIEFLADNPGNWFHHCHNLYHMEAGMANVVSFGS